MIGAVQDQPIDHVYDHPFFINDCFLSLYNALVVHGENMSKIVLFSLNVIDQDAVSDNDNHLFANVSG